MKRIVMLALTLAFALVGCDGSGGGAEKLTVVTSVEPHAWLIRQIGGDRVKVLTLVGSGESPATYQPTDREVSEVMRSRIYFATGVPFEKGGWRTALSGQKMRVVDLREGLPLRHLHAHDHEGIDTPHEGEDPHIWLSPELLALQAVTVTETLAAADPEGEAEYRKNLGVLKKSLGVLDGDLREILAPVRGRRVYVFHPSWGYFLDAYGLVQVPIEIEGKEPSESEITSLVKSAKKDAIRVIFVQPQIAGQSAAAVARAVGAEVRRIDPLAADVPANLRKVAKAIAEALE
jgi:zinc transport system substrate-binding protein